MTDWYFEYWSKRKKRWRERERERKRRERKWKKEGWERFETLKLLLTGVVQNVTLSIFSLSLCLSIFFLSLSLFHVLSSIEERKKERERVWINCYCSLILPISFEWGKKKRKRKFRSTLHPGNKKFTLLWYQEGQEKSKTNEREWERERKQRERERESRDREREKGRKREKRK